MAEAEEEGDTVLSISYSNFDLLVVNKMRGRQPTETQGRLGSFLCRLVLTCFSCCFIIG